MTDLVEALSAIQRANGWTDDQMATILGSARPLWTGVRLGKLALSKRVLGRVSQEIPVLQPAVVRYLTGAAEAKAA